MLAVKGNQSTLQAAVQDTCARARAAEATPPAVDRPDCHTTVNGGHGRLETRQCRVIGDREILAYVNTQRHWPDLRRRIEMDPSAACPGRGVPGGRMSAPPRRTAHTRLRRNTRTQWGRKTSASRPAAIWPVGKKSWAFDTFAIALPVHAAGLHQVHVVPSEYNMSFLISLTRKRMAGGPLRFRRYPLPTVGSPRKRRIAVSCHTGDKSLKTTAICAERPCTCIWQTAGPG